MSDTIKFIFKTIIKVPVYILISYFVANIFFFALFYFKFMGVSYSVMQTALENNYIPPTEKASIERSLNDIDNSSVLISDVYIIGGDSKRRQYGKEVTVGIAYKYKWLWPLMPQEYGQEPGDLSAGTTFEDGAGGSDLEYGKSNYSDAQLDELREKKAANNEIRIEYTVPGLQYYSDLD